ncbi:MAG: hypothetical protein M3Q16_08095 [Pseudomonadota bacterium]|nr:hypothetical protein [Pseudomonadota bacterium]
MQKIIGGALSGTLFYLRNHIGAAISLAGLRRRAERFHLLYCKLVRVSQGLGKWSKDALRRNPLNEDEGLGAVYDKRKWMEAYYDKSDKTRCGHGDRSTCLPPHSWLGPASRLNNITGLRRGSN